MQWVGQNNKHLRVIHRPAVNSFEKELFLTENDPQPTAVLGVTRNVLLLAVTFWSFYYIYYAAAAATASTACNAYCNFVAMVAHLDAAAVAPSVNLF